MTRSALPILPSSKSQRSGLRSEAGYVARPLLTVAPSDRKVHTARFFANRTRVAA